jgi:predicted phage terminase large subunit-like protein
MDPDTFAPEGGKTYYFFPELFPAESCKRLRAKQGSFFYSMLYLNNPKDPSNADFNINDLGEWVYDDEGNILLFHHDGSKEVVPVDSCKRVLHWDPAMDAKSKKFGSRNAMTVTYKDTRGRLFLAEAYAEKKEPTLLFSRFIGFHQRHLVHVAAIEDVGFQRTLKFPLFYEMRRLNHVFHVEERAPIGSKETRIRGLLPYVETHNYFVRRGLADFREEMKGFPVFQTNDLLDSGAAALELFGLGAVQNEKQRKRSSVAEARRLDTRSATTGY